MAFNVVDISIPVLAFITFTSRHCSLGKILNVFNLKHELSINENFRVGLCFEIRRFW